MLFSAVPVNLDRDDQDGEPLSVVGALTMGVILKRISWNIGSK